MRSNDNGLLEGNVFEASSFRLLKSKAVYGSNANGKSNVAKAMGAFVMMVSRSVAEEQLPEIIWNDRFKLITDWDDQPIFFQLTFLHEAVAYRYGFQILQGKVSYEWLYSGNDTDQVEYFMRNGKTLNLNGDYFKDIDSFVKQVALENSELLRADSLFLTASALTGSKFTGGLRDQIRTIITVDGLNDQMVIDYAMKRFMSGNEDQKKIITNFLKRADTSIEGLNIDELTDELMPKSLARNLKNMVKESDRKVISLFSFHSRYDENGVFKDKLQVPFAEWESEGTSKLFSVGTVILEALLEGRTIVIDEFEARLHPNLSLKILQMFHNKHTNRKNAQLIFITHDSGLLRRAGLRRDQICLVNKDKYGISSLKTLIEFKGVRKDASYEKEYLNGTYTAIPFLDEMELFEFDANGLQEAQ